MSETARICKTCKVEQPIDQFKPYKVNGREGRRWECWGCYYLKEKARASTPEARAKQAAHRAKPDVKAAQLAYDADPGNKARKYELSQMPHRKAAQKAYADTPRAKELKKAAAQKPERKATMAAYEKTPHRKALKLEQLRTPESLAVKKKYLSLPSTKKKRCEYMVRRTAKKRANGGDLSPGLRDRLFQLQKGKCACCGEKLVARYAMDHIVPLARGGKNEDSNIQLLNAVCNSKKRAKDPIDYMQEKGKLL